LRPGDIITAVNDNRVQTSNALIRAVAGIPPGGAAKLSVIRDGQALEVAATVGRRPSEPEE
jgi:serine protease Do